MKHISLGGLDVSRIGLGTMAMSGYYLDPSSSEAESIRTIHRLDRAARGQGDLPAQAAWRADRPRRLRAAGHAAAEPVAVPAAGRPAGHGHEPERARDRLPAVDQRGRAVETRRGEPFYGFAEMSGGRSSDEFTLRYPSRPRGPSRCPRLRVADVGRLEVHGRKQ
jgi:hypothetical protein